MSFIENIIEVIKNSKKLFESQKYDNNEERNERRQFLKKGLDCSLCVKCDHIFQVEQYAHSSNTRIARVFDFWSEGTSVISRDCLIDRTLNIKDKIIYKCSKFQDKSLKINKKNVDKKQVMNEKDETLVSSINSRLPLRKRYHLPPSI